MPLTRAGGEEEEEECAGCGSLQEGNSASERVREENWAAGGVWGAQGLQRGKICTGTPGRHKGGAAGGEGVPVPAEPW